MHRYDISQIARKGLYTNEKDALSKVGRLNGIMADKEYINNIG